MTVISTVFLTTLLFQPPVDTTTSNTLVPIVILIFTQVVINVAVWWRSTKGVAVVDGKVDGVDMKVEEALLTITNLNDQITDLKKNLLAAETRHENDLKMLGQLELRLTVLNEKYDEQQRHVSRLEEHNTIITGQLTTIGNENKQGLQDALKLAHELASERKDALEVHNRVQKLEEQLKLAKTVDELVKGMVTQFSPAIQQIAASPSNLPITTEGG